MKRRARSKSGIPAAWPGDCQRSRPARFTRILSVSLVDDDLRRIVTDRLTDELKYVADSAKKTALKSGRPVAVLPASTI
jgi:hypothetical protein